MSTRRKPNDTQKPPEKQADNVLKLPELPPREYNTALIDSFLDVVFGASPIDDEEILTWAVKPARAPGFPVTDSSLLKTLASSKKAKALYFGASTCHRDGEGSLRNRGALFTRLAVVVLDDIGTKVHKSLIPKAAVPTYILETSKGNYQYGYVLSEPVTNSAAADALIQIVYNAGLSDQGGKMATKIVRLPEGVNGKVGDGQGFVTKLVNMDGPYWSPQDLLDALLVDAKWSDIEADALESLARLAPHRTGTTPWSGSAALMPNLDGVVDPVLEWLNSTDSVVSDNGEWVTIVCPWHPLHTSGNSLASYAPVGRGTMPEHRGFKCFHEHCSSQTTVDFLAHVVAQDGPRAGVFDPVAQLTRDWAYDVINDSCWHLTSPYGLETVAIKAFNSLHPKSASVAKPDGKEVQVKHSALWLASPSRATVFGQVFDPSTTARIVTYLGKNRINTYSPPRWADVTIAQRHINKFKNFMEYIVPDDTEREYFLDWLGAKARDMAFRGCAMLMIAPNFGTGRTTLADMITTLFTRYNVETIAFDKMIGESVFNDWMEKPLVITNETKNVGKESKYATYERLKELIDPRPIQMRINPKYGKQRVSVVHSSFLMLSNHEDALHIPDNDRRIYVIRNAIVPEKPEYFTSLNQWLEKSEVEGIPDWAPHVWKWLRHRKIDTDKLFAPPEITEGKQAMARNTESTLDQFVRLLCEYSPTEYMTASMFTVVAEAMTHELDLHEVNKWKGVLTQVYRNRTFGVGGAGTLSYRGVSSRLRIITSRASHGTYKSGADIGSVERAVIRSHLADFKLEEAIAYVKKHLVTD